MVLFLCVGFTKITIISVMFFKFNNYCFSTGTPTTRRLDDGIPVTHFSEWQNGAFKFFS